MDLFSVRIIREFPRRLPEMSVRLALAALLAWGLLVWASAAHYREAGWDRIHGWTGSPAPVLTQDFFLGQPLLPESGRESAILGHVSPRYATYGREASGRVELVLLRGAEPPGSREELTRRKIHSRIVPAERLSDNELGRFNVPGLILDGKGLFLLVRRAVSADGKGEPGPLTVWLDSDRSWTGGKAFILGSGPDGRISAQAADGHISLGWGYDRPSIRVFLGLKAWHGYAFAGFWLVLSMVFLTALPRAGERLRAWWLALSAPDKILPRKDRRGPAWLPWLVIAAGVIFTLYLQGVVKEGVFYSGDAGIKLLMIKQFLAGDLQGWLDLPVENWVRELWAKGLYPFEPPFVHLHQDRYFVAFPMVFPLLNTPMFGFLGYRGLYLIPLVAVWLLWLRFYLVSRTLGLDHRASALGLAGLVLASPLTLYSAMFWGHTLAVLTAFTGMSLALFPKKGTLRAGAAVLSGLVTGLGVWFRAETVCLGGATALVIFALTEPGRKLKPAALYTLGFGSGVVLLWIAVSPLFGQYALGFGHPLGHHAVISGTGLDLSALTALAAKGWEAFFRLQENLQGFFPLAGVTAVLLAGLALFRGPGLGRSLRGLVIVYGLFILTASPILEPPGKQWGPRYMFLTLPLICLAAALAWQRISASAPGLIRLGTALVLAVALVLGGNLNLREGSAALDRDYSGRVLPSLQFIQGREEKVVAVSDQHIAQELAAAFGGRAWFHTREPGELVLLAQGLQAQGIPSCLFLYNDGEKPPQGFVFQAHGEHYKTIFSPLGKKGRYRILVMDISRV